MHPTFPIPILQTKLHRPGTISSEFPRERLHRILDRALDLQLALVSAPAGFGKTTLVSHWIESRPEPAAWLALDASEGDPITFAAYFVAAIRGLFPGACPETLALLSATSSLPVEVLGRTLINELAALEGPCLVVLDDYHRIPPTSEVHSILRRMLERPPQGVHLILVTRRDPPLGISARRAAGRLAEVRQEELQFTSSEASDLLRRISGRTPDAAVLARLDQNLEGWAVGLRLLALALARVENPDPLLDKLTDIAAAQDYLVSEVIEALPPSLCRWLLASSILDRFNADLCESVCRSSADTGTRALDGPSFVEELKARNLFLVPLDVEGEWFRYHHLFQKLLETQLRRRSGENEVRDLRRRASSWFESRALIDESIRYALDAGDDDGAALIVERNRGDAVTEDRGYSLEHWLSMLPESEVRGRPALLLTRAWCRYYRLNYRSIPPLLDEIHQASDHREVEEDLAREMDFFLGFFHLLAGEGASALAPLERAVRKGSSKILERSGEAEAIFALALQMEGRESSARKRLEVDLAALDSMGPVRRTRVVAAMAFLDLVSADLEAASNWIGLLFRLAEQGDYRYAEAFAHYLRGVVHLQRNELEPAENAFAFAVARRHRFHKRAAVDAYAGLALAREALGRSAEADEAVDACFRYCELQAEPTLLAIAESLRQHLSFVRGEAAANAPLAAENPGEPGFWWIELPGLTNLRALLAQPSNEALEGALAGLRRRLEVDSTQHNPLHRISTLCLLALAEQRSGLTDRASDSVAAAVRLATSGGCIRPFLAPGPEIPAILAQRIFAGAEAAFVQRILEAAEPSGSRSVAPPGPAIAAAIPRHPPSGQLAEREGPDPLTNRELDVLELLAKRLQNKEIAARLSISSHTVNDHLKRIYQKLGVKGRRQAVREGIARHLIHSP